MIFYSKNRKLLVLLCTNELSYEIRFKKDSKYYDSLWLCVRSSMVPAC